MFKQGDKVRLTVVGEAYIETVSPITYDAYQSKGYLFISLIDINGLYKLDRQPKAIGGSGWWTNKVFMLPFVESQQVKAEVD